MISKKKLLKWIDENIFVPNELRDLDVVDAGELLRFIEYMEEVVV